MINGVKVFGSYKPQIFKLKDDDSNHHEIFSTSCCIPCTWTKLTLIDKTPFNHDTTIFKFSLLNESQSLHLPIFSYLLIQAPGRENDGSDAIRPYANISDSSSIGYFEIIVKRYDEWGSRENPTTHFLFTKTDHSYRPPGAVSNYIHELAIGDQLQFKHDRNCIRSFQYPFTGVKTITMIAVGAGISALFQAIHKILEDDVDIKIMLLYGVREVRDILLRQQLESCQTRYEQRFHILYCVGSRWANIHLGMKSKDYQPPPLPKDFSTLKNAELGWVNEDKIRRFGHPPSFDTKIIICGLPGVYDKLCGPRSTPVVAVGSILYNIGYTDDMTIKL